MQIECTLEVKYAWGVQKQKWVNKQKEVGMHMSQRKNSSSRWRTEESSAFSRLFLSPAPSVLSKKNQVSFPRAKLHFSCPCLSVQWWQAQRIRAPTICLDPRCTGMLGPLGTSLYVSHSGGCLSTPGTYVVDTCRHIWVQERQITLAGFRFLVLTKAMNIVPWAGHWSLTTDPIGFWIVGTQCSPISSGWINCLLFSLLLLIYKCPTQQIYQPAATLLWSNTNRKPIAIVKQKQSIVQLKVT